MRYILGILVLLASLHAMAVTPLAKGEVLGVAEGIYAGGTQLKSHTFFVPNTYARTTRQLKGDVIIAKTKAYYRIVPLGIDWEVAGAQARLRVIPKDGGEFDLLDLDNNGEKAGDGYCSERSCTFYARVMDGELTLVETWVANEEGFVIHNGWQDFGDKIATYGTGNGAQLTPKE